MWKVVEKKKKRPVPKPQKPSVIWCFNKGYAVKYYPFPSCEKMCPVNGDPLGGDLSEIIVEAHSSGFEKHLFSFFAKGDKSLKQGELHYGCAIKARNAEDFGDKMGLYEVYLSTNLADLELSFPWAKK